jgi:hypothetical protein
VKRLYTDVLGRAQVADPEPAVPRRKAGARTQTGGSRRPEVTPSAPHSTGQPDAARGQSIPPIALVDRHREAGLEFQYFNGDSGLKYILESTGGGVAALDFDGDGWPDLYFPQGCRIPIVADDPTYADRLFRNLGNDAFTDVTSGAGLGDHEYSQGCTAGDYNNDGFADLAVANLGLNVLYQNNGDGTFSDVTLASGLCGRHWSSSLAFGDLDRDGNLDLYVVNYVLEPFRVCGTPPDHVFTCSPVGFKAEEDALFRNRGDGAFEDVTMTSGVVAEDGKGLGIVIADLDNDGWPDIYVANDGTPNFLFHNETGEVGAPLRFVERGMPAGAAVSGNGLARAGMGIACGDLNGDGRLDLFVTNFYLESATYFKNQGDLIFVDASRAAAIDDATRLLLGFGTQSIDIDLDGRLDLFIANGHVGDFRPEGIPWKMRPQLLYNLGESFAEASQKCGDYFAGEYLGRGVARLDWDRDGRPDLVVVHQDRPAALLHNESHQTGRRLVLDLRGVSSNRDAIGARITVSCDGTTRTHEVCSGDGFFASNERRAVLGLGSAASVSRLEVRWPNGQVDHWTDLPADSALLLIEGRPPVITQLHE